MKLLFIILAGAIPGTILILSIIIIILCFYRNRKQNQQQQQQQFISSPQANASEDSAFQSAIAKLHLSHKSNSKSSLRFHHLHQLNHQENQLLNHFTWENHPRLVSDAAENGWARFVFNHKTLISRSSPLWGISALCDGGKPQEFEGVKSEYMQTIRINSTNTLKEVDDISSTCIRMSLPLPGPPLIGVSFPQEAYFEITILYLQPMSRGARASKRLRDGEDDKLKLIKEESNVVVGDHDGEVKKMNSPFKEGKNKKFAISLGLTMGGSTLTKAMPGINQGSIAFHSNGSVYLDGLKLVSESERSDWAGVNRVIGCGYNPNKKKVYFTVDSELVHVIRCNSDSYKNPLYPIISSNSDIMILVNLGQAAFKYAPANANRTPNPCFTKSSPGTKSPSSITGYEDSRELFSMGKIDCEWLDGNKKSRSAGNSKNSCRSSRRSSGNWDDGSVVVDIDGESDLFEISLNNV